MISCNLKSYQTATSQRKRSRSREKKTTEIIDLESTIYSLEKGDIVGRYYFVRSIDDGTFGRVIKVRDGNYNYFALKIIRRLSDDDHHEFKIVRKLLSHPYDLEHKGRDHIVRVFEMFRYQGSNCILFQELGLSLSKQLHAQSNRPYDLRVISRVLWDCLQALDYIHSLKMVHADLKTENILFISENQKNVKLIDFGSSTYCPSYGIIQTRSYRAPEVLLGLQWDTKVDIWSLGCIGWEMMTSHKLFPASSDIQQLAMIQQCCGHLPAWMVQHNKAYYDQCRLNYPQANTKAEEIDCVKRIRPIHTAHDQFTDLLKKMTYADPRLRWNCQQLMTHPFFGVEPYK